MEMGDECGVSVVVVVVKGANECLVYCGSV